MNKKIAFSIFLALILFSSISMIHAVDVNMTDFDRVSSGEDIAVQAEDGGSDIANPDESSVIVKNQTEITASKNVVYGYYVVNLKDLNSSADLADKQVTFVINNVNHIATTDSNGIAGITIKGTGKYTVNAYFAGDGTYESSSKTSSVEVLSTIKAKDISKYYKGSAKYSATFLDKYGNVLKNKMVTITVAGVSYSRKTDSKGVASLAINFKPGTYKVVAENPVTGHKATTSFKVLSTVTADNLKKVVGDNKKFRATFLKSNGKPLAKQFVKIKINSKYYKIKTNKNGQVWLSFNNFKKGTYKVISYNKDGLSRTNTVTSYGIATSKVTTGFYTFIPNEKRMIYAKLTTNIDDNGWKVIKFKINGKTYSRTTNSNGIASLDLGSFKKGLYTFSCVFEGNKFFKSSSASNLVTIVDSPNDLALTVKSTKNFGQGAGTLLKVAFTAGGVPLVKRTMTFVMDGEYYTVETDNSGIGCVPVYLDVGNHTVYYHTYREYKIDGTSDSCQITVFERSPCKLVWAGATSFKDSSQAFKVRVTDLNGNPISGGGLQTYIDYETYYGSVGSDGYGTVTARASIGKYNACVEFLGNNNFLPNSTSKTINIALSKFAKGINEKNTISNLKNYIKATKNCQVNNAKIKALAKSLIKGLTNDIDKAKAIFNYVRDEISYDYYFNSHYGAVGALKYYSANCVDQAHLLVALYRAAGFKARYVHGICTFGDGPCGHVWTQVLIGNTWVIGDPINCGNSLGKITNWNVNNYKLRAIYSSLPF